MVNIIFIDNETKEAKAQVAGHKIAMPIPRIGETATAYDPVNERIAIRGTVVNVSTTYYGSGKIQVRLYIDVE